MFVFERERCVSYCFTVRFEWWQSGGDDGLASHTCVGAHTTTHDTVQRALQMGVTLLFAPSGVEWDRQWLAYEAR